MRNIIFSSLWAPVGFHIPQSFARSTRDFSAVVVNGVALRRSHRGKAPVKNLSKVKVLGVGCSHYNDQFFMFHLSRMPGFYQLVDAIFIHFLEVE